MTKIIAEVMPKPEILDPQGKAVAAALTRQGVAEIAEVRVGKRFELTLDADADEALAIARRVASDVLANEVIENVVSVRLAGEDAGNVDGSTDAATGSVDSGHNGEA